MHVHNTNWFNFTFVNMVYKYPGKYFYWLLVLICLFQVYLTHICISVVQFGSKLGFEQLCLGYGGKDRYKILKMHTKLEIIKMVLKVITFVLLWPIPFMHSNVVI